MAICTIPPIHCGLEAWAFGWFYPGLGINSFALSLFSLLLPSTLKKSNWSDSLYIKELFALFKEWFTSNSFFSPCFSPFYAQNKRANQSSSFFWLFVKDDICSRCIFEKSEESDLLSLLIKKEQWEWSTLEKSKSHFRSFTLKTLSIRTKNQHANSPPWFYPTHCWLRHGYFYDLILPTVD